MSSSYRVPETPASVGGLDGRAVGFAMLVFLIANSYATQYAARKLEYQPALGEPIFCAVRTKTPCFYAPWRWGIWTAQSMLNSRADRDVRWILIQSAGIAFSGIFLAIGAFMLAQHMRIRAMAQQAKDLHGSAQWAKKRDVKRSGLVTTQQGVYVGAWKDGRRLRYLKHNGQDHVLAFAPTRSGKGISLVIPTLLGWTHSAVVYDIKGENWDKTSGFRSSFGPCFRFAPADIEPERSSRFNPLAEIRINTEYDVQDAQIVAQILTSHLENSSTPYWHEAGEALMTAAILHTCYYVSHFGHTAALRDVYDALMQPGAGIREILGEWMTFQHTPLGPHPAVAAAAQEMIDKEDRNFDGVLSTARTVLKLYADPIVARNTITSDFRIKDLVNFELPVSLYIVVPASQQERLRPLTRLIFTLIINRLTDTIEPNRHRLLMLIDEFPTLQKMPIFAHALSYCAGYNIKCFLIAQDLRQIEEAYGQKESIVSNCTVRVAFSPNTYETAKLLSNLLGNRTILRKSFSFSGRRTSPMPGNMSTSMDHQERPLLTADEIMRLAPPAKIGEGPNERIVRPGEMLVFQSGQRPILGIQLLYFFDPELMRRSQMIAPLSLGAIVSNAFTDRPETTARLIPPLFPKHKAAKKDIDDNPSLRLFPV